MIVWNTGYESLKASPAGRTWVTNLPLGLLDPPGPGVFSKDVTAFSVLQLGRNGGSMVRESLYDALYTMTTSYSEGCQSSKLVYLIYHVNREEVCLGEVTGKSQVVMSPYPHVLSP